VNVCSVTVKTKMVTRRSRVQFPCGVVVYMSWLRMVFCVLALSVVYLPERERKKQRERERERVREINRSEKVVSCANVVCVCERERVCVSVCV